jgi:type I restriction enzyme R subunit
MATAEQRARANIDKLLEQAGWSVQDVKAANLLAARGVAPSEHGFRPGHHFTS